MTEPARRPGEPTRPLDIRVGSATDGLTPLSVAERSLAAGAWQWLGLLAVATAALAADQLTKRLMEQHLDPRAHLAVSGFDVLRTGRRRSHRRQIPAETGKKALADRTRPAPLARGKAG